MNPKTIHMISNMIGTFLGFAFVVNGLLFIFYAPKYHEKHKPKDIPRQNRRARNFGICFLVGGIVILVCRSM